MKLLHIQKLPSIRRQAQIALLNQDYEQAYQAYKQAWQMGDLSQAEGVIRCLLKNCRQPDYATARMLYRRMTQREKRESINWFYIYFRDYYGQNKANKILPLAHRLGADFVNIIYAVHYYPYDQRLALKYFRRNYVCVMFNCQHPWSAKVVTLLTFLPPFKGRFDESWNEFACNRETQECSQPQSEAILQGLKEAIRHVKNLFSRTKK